MLPVSRGRNCEWPDTVRSGSLVHDLLLLYTNFLLHDREHKKKNWTVEEQRLKLWVFSCGKKGPALHCLLLYWRAKEISTDNLIWWLFLLFRQLSFFFQIGITEAEIAMQREGNIEIPLDEMKDGLATDQY